MITYDRLWNTLEEKNITKYALVYKYGISPSTLIRLRRNESITTHTLNSLCNVLGCVPADVLTYVPDEITIENLDGHALIVEKSPAAANVSRKDEADVAMERSESRKDNALADKLSALLKEKEISAKELSGRSGVPLPTIRNILYHKTLNPRIETLQNISDALSVPLKDLL